MEVVQNYIHFLRALSGVWSISIGAGLPNITGRLPIRHNIANKTWGQEAYGALKVNTASVGVQAMGVPTDGVMVNVQQIQFNAGGSNTIYNTSETVTPLSLSAKFFIKY